MCPLIGDRMNQSAGLCSGTRQRRRQNKVLTGSTSYICGALTAEYEKGKKKRHLLLVLLSYTGRVGIWGRLQPQAAQEHS